MGGTLSRQVQLRILFALSDNNKPSSLQAILFPNSSSQHCSRKDKRSFPPGLGEVQLVLVEVLLALVVAWDGLALAEVLAQAWALDGVVALASLGNRCDDVNSNILSSLGSKSLGHQQHNWVAAA